MCTRVKSLYVPAEILYTGLHGFYFISSNLLDRIHVLQFKLLYQHIMNVLLDSTFTLSDFKMASFVAILQECEAFRGEIPSRLEPYEIITRYLIKLMFRLLCEFPHVNLGAQNQIVCCCLPGNPQEVFSSKLSSAAFGIFFKRHSITLIKAPQKEDATGNMQGQPVLIIA